MTSPNLKQPTFDDIARNQNQDAILRFMLASRHYYARARWIQYLGTWGAIAFALAAPVVLLFYPDRGPLLGALAGLWIFASRLGLSRLRASYQRKGATAQEQFDCAVFRLDWNKTIAVPLSPEEIRHASGNMNGIDAIRNWYATPGKVDWPRSVTLCQRANAVWARRQHHLFGVVLYVAATTWAVVGILIAVWQDASLSQYLTTIALPSLPALLDATDLAQEHIESSWARGRIEVRLDGLLDDGTATNLDIREVQDELFDLRKSSPIVPEWFYKIIKPGYEEDMTYAAETRIN